MLQIGRARVGADQQAGGLIELVADGPLRRSLDDQPPLGVELAGRDAVEGVADPHAVVEGIASTTVPATLACVRRLERGQRSRCARRTSAPISFSPDYQTTAQSALARPPNGARTIGSQP